MCRASEALNYWQHNTKCYCLKNMTHLALKLMTILLFPTIRYQFIGNPAVMELSAVGTLLLSLMCLCER